MFYVCVAYDMSAIISITRLRQPEPIKFSIRNMILGHTSLMYSCFHVIFILSIFVEILLLY